jgi:hypothetical protein
VSHVDTRLKGDGEVITTPYVAGVEISSPSTSPSSTPCIAIRDTCGLDYRFSNRPDLQSPRDDL